MGRLHRLAQPGRRPDADYDHESNLSRLVGLTGQTHRAGRLCRGGESDPAKRIPIWRQLQAIFYDEVPTIKLGEFFQLYGISNKLTNYTPLAWPCFWNVKIT